MTIPARSADFQRAFVALRYLWGARGTALSEGLEPASPQPQVAAVLSGLAHPERAERARVLGVELGRIATALELRSLQR